MCLLVPYFECGVDGATIVRHSAEVAPPLVIYHNYAYTDVIIVLRAVCFKLQGHHDGAQSAALTFSPVAQRTCVS